MIIIGMWGCLILGFVFWIKLILAGHPFLGCLVASFFFVMVFVIFRFDKPENKEMVYRMQREKENNKMVIGYKCPNCGENTGHSIGVISKSVSIGAAGLASNKIGKTYKCDKCGYMW